MIGAMQGRILRLQDAQYLVVRFLLLLCGNMQVRKQNQGNEKDMNRRSQTSKALFISSRRSDGSPRCSLILRIPKITALAEMFRAGYE